MERFGKLVLIILLLALVIFIKGALVCWLWGFIAVAVFGLPALGFWQSIGLVWLIHLIFPSRSGTTQTIKNRFDW